MGFKEIWGLIICYLVLMLMIKCIKGQEDEDLYERRNSLDSFIHNSAKNRTGRIITGNLYDIPLPSNFSGISASFIHIRSSRLWSTGVNFSFFYIPPRTLSWPFSKRIRIVYENLGNWSTEYYNVLNYTFVAPVIGFLAYDATNLSSSSNSGVVEIRTLSDLDHVLIRFLDVSLPGEVNVTDVQCVQFKSNGEVMEFSDVNVNVNVSSGYTCIARGHGHFGLVIPISSIPVPSRGSKKKMWKRWVIGFVVGICALVLVIGVGVLVYKCMKSKRIEKMEKESERSEGLGSIWVGRSRMPKGNGTRTPPIIEDSYAP